MYQRSASIRPRASSMRTARRRRRADGGRCRAHGRAVSQALDEGRHQVHPSLGMIGNKYTVDWSLVPGRRLVRAAAPAVAGAAGGARRASAVSRTAFTLHPRVAQIVATAPRCSPASCRSTGAAPRRWPTPRSSKTAFASALRPGLRPRHLLPSPRRAARSEQRRTYTPLQHIAERQPAFRSSTRCCRKRRCWASNTAIPPPSPIAS
jgi:hypothetical protein